MVKRNGVQGLLKKKILERDDYRCAKCGKFNNLEIHHIMPVVYGGQDIESNLITLCRSCHKFAPDDMIDFFKWASHHLPVDLQKAKEVSKTVLTLVKYKKDFNELFNSNKKEDYETLLEILDIYFKDLWGVFISGEMEQFGKFMAKYQLDKEMLMNCDKKEEEVNNISKEEINTKSYKID